MGIGGRYTGPTEVKYLFIDGGCLRELKQFFSKEFCEYRVPEVRYERLKGANTKVFFYDAIPTKNPDETDEDYHSRVNEQASLLDEIRMLDGFHVYEGDLKRRRKRGNEQKKVDVKIAVDMLTHTFRGNMHRASLLTNDLDFKPLVDALVQNGMYVDLIYVLGKTNADLISSADKKSPIRPDQFFSWVMNAHQYNLPKRHHNRTPENASIVSTLEVNEIEYRFSEYDNVFYFQRFNVQNDTLTTHGYNYEYHDLEKLKLWISLSEDIKFD